ncbi:MAG: hypothetical protein AB8G15_02150 [Saprospiraceae bacterium]
MGLLDKLFGNKKNSTIYTDEELVNAGVCPNCWGHQAYDGQYLQYEKDQVNPDKKNRKAFIQKFVETNITGIKLKKTGPKLSCPACKTNY